MEVRCHPDSELDGVLVANPSGALNENGGAVLWREVADKLNESQPSLMVDLSHAEMITSAGIGALVRFHHRINKLGGNIALFGANSRCREVIEAVMLTEILNLCDSIEDARDRMVV
jgi:anti-anti-sigma factor